MMDSNVEPNDYFIISKEFNLNEDEEINLYSFYDYEKKNTLTLSVLKDKIYICLKPNLFGSVFYGNHVYENPSFFIIKEIDPLLLLVNIFYLSSKSNRGYETLSLLAFIAEYNRLLKEMLVDTDEVVIEETIEVVNRLIENKPDEYFETICDKLFVDEYGIAYFKLNVVKVINFLNSKLSNNKEEDVKPSASILTNFIPNEIAKEFLNFKNISLENKIETNPQLSNPNSFKRKKSYDQEELVAKSQKKVKPKPAQVKKVEVSKDQRCITDLFKKR